MSDRRDDGRFRDDLPAGRRIREEVDQEIRFHLEMRVAELIELGFDAEEARAEAHRMFGDLEKTRSICIAADRRHRRSRERKEYVREFVQDIVHGARQLRRRPTFALAAVLTLAVGIGATTAVFSAADHVLLRPLPYRTADRVVTLWEVDRAAGAETQPVSPGNFLEWSDRSTVFQAMAVMEPSGFDLTGDGPPRSVQAWQVSEGFFEALGVEPILGRTFTREEYAPGGPAVFMISHGLWERRFGRDASIVGRTVQVDFAAGTIVGVLPPDLEYPPGDPRDLWAPKRWREDEWTDRRSTYMFGVARLKPGATVEEARAELSGVARRLAEEYPATNASLGVKVVPLREQVVGSVRPALLVLLGAVAFVLLIACGNVASLLLARGAERERELGIRAALGAGRARLARQLLTEAILLGTLGGIGGLAVGRLGLKLLRALSPPGLPRLEAMAIDGRVLAFAAGITLLTALLFGLAPALRFSRPGIGQALRGSGRSVAGGGRRNRLHAGLVVVEIGLALVLLIGAGLLARSFLDLTDNDPGFETDHRISLQLFLWDRNPTPEERLQRVDELERELGALPGVAGIGVVVSLPFHPTGIELQRVFHVNGRPEPPPGQETRVHFNFATPDYFRVMGIPLLRGRMFEEGHRDGPVPLLISRTLARRHFPDEDPIGREVSIGRGERAYPAEIIGVVGDVRPRAFDSDPRPEIYQPYDRAGTGSVTLVVQTRTRPEPMIPVLRERVWQVDPGQTIYHTATLDEMLSDTLVQRRFNLVLIAAFSLTALILAAIGIYGLISFTTSARTREIGVRLALGATRSNVVRMIVLQGLRLAIPGIMIGIVAALGLTRFIEHMLYGVRPTDPAVFLQLTILMLGIAALAAYLPARRAATADPVDTLREE